MILNKTESIVKNKHLSFKARGNRESKIIASHDLKILTNVLKPKIKTKICGERLCRVIATRVFLSMQEELCLRHKIEDYFNSMHFYSSS